MGRIKVYLNKKNNQVSLTLAELLIATVLMGVVLLTVASLDITSRRLYTKPERDAVVLNDLNLAMEYMIKTIEAGIGDPTRLAFQLRTAATPSACGGICCTGANESFAVRLDSDQDGRTNEDFNFEFCYDPTNHYILAWPLGEYISNNTTGFNITQISPYGSGISEVIISLTGRYNPDEAVSIDNPELTIEGRAYIRAASAR